MLAAWIRRWLPIAGLAVTFLAVLDPLEGFPFVLIGGVLTVMAAIQEQSPRLPLAIWGLAIAAVGCAALIGLSLAGGVGPAAGRSWWWLVVLAPYPTGVVLFVAANVLLLRERGQSGVRS